jgi:hypothetical protein
MLITQPALLCLEATWNRMCGRPGQMPKQELALVPHAGAITADSTPTSQEKFASSTAPQGELSPADGPAPSPVPGRPSSPLTPSERRARAAALRALALSRGRRFDAARAAFAEAARLDPALDLTRTPAFWKLERAAHEAAIDAYVDAGRDADAAVLRARVRSTFRPKALRPRPDPALAP